MKKPSHQIAAGQALITRVSAIAAALLLAASAFPLTGCAVFEARAAYKNRQKPFPREMFQPKPVTRQVGQIVQVDETYGFAVVDAGLNPALAAGESLEVRSSGELDGRVTAKLRVSGETMRPFFVADVIEGKPSKGEMVTRTTMEGPAPLR